MKSTKRSKSRLHQGNAVDDVIQVDDKWYISLDSPRADTRNQVLKENDTFVVFGRQGELTKAGLGEHGLYHRGTRHLSQWELIINGHRPILLNSTIKEDNSELIVESTTTDIVEEDEVVLAKGMLHVSRSLVVQNAVLVETLKLTNFARHPVDLTIEYWYGADFRDIFEVRGVKREHRNDVVHSLSGDGAARFTYTGLDDVERSTEITFPEKAKVHDSQRAELHLWLAPGVSRQLSTRVQCQGGRPFFGVSDSHGSDREDVSVREAETAECAEIVTSNEQFNEWIKRSFADLTMLTSETVYGRYPYAGVPWFSTPFGRDALITCLQTLWLHPRLSRGVLGFLAATQASDVDRSVEAEPGKIIHEMREGEMAALGEIPFRRYYGTVDATPLFVVLAGHYYRRTGDRAFLEFIWPNIKRAVNWIDEYGDCDGDGFVEYLRHEDRGLVQQGWKDSDDSIFHNDGTPAEGPIALCEVQGYVYQARLEAAMLADMLGETSWADTLRRQAAELKDRFHAAFWIDALGTYAIALQGDKKRCGVRSSNAGHLLYSGIVPHEFAGILAATLMAPESFSGWGIRTIAEGEARYNPMSYHNGSVWPHDTAIIAAGLARYGFQKEAATIMTGLFESSEYLDFHRLPELFCGFPRMPGHAPTLYPVACSPQAWAAGSVFMVLQACLGLTFSAEAQQLQFYRAALPPYLQWIELRNLKVADATVDLTVRRHARDVGVNVEHKDGHLDVVAVV